MGHPQRGASLRQPTPALQALGHLTALPSAHTGSALGLYGGCVLVGPLLHEQNSHWVLHLFGARLQNKDLQDFSALFYKSVNP